MKQLIYIYLALTVLCGCDKEEFNGFDIPFIRIATSTGESATTVLSNVNATNTYLVTVSSRPLEEPLTVSYEIVAGDGLEAGTDYEIITRGNSLTFEPGIYDMPIRIKWMANKVDESKDNTLTIRLTGNNRGFLMGTPGLDCAQKELVIRKQN